MGLGVQELRTRIEILSVGSRVGLEKVELSEGLKTSLLVGGRPETNGRQIP